MLCRRTTNSLRMCRRQPGSACFAVASGDYRDMQVGCRTFQLAVRAEARYYRLEGKPMATGGGSGSHNTNATWCGSQNPLKKQLPAGADKDPIGAPFGTFEPAKQKVCHGEVLQKV